MQDRENDLEKVQDMISAAEADNPCEGCPNKAGISRVDFLSWMTVGWTAFAASLGGFVAMIARYLAPNVVYEPPQSFRIGNPDEYVAGEVSTRWKSKHGIWIVRFDDRIVALSTVCTHLGCTPNWLAGEQKFKCPCHGSGFRSTGVNFEGPAPRPLERYKIYLDDNGVLVVDKTKKFRAEKDQWSHPDSFVAV